MSNNYDQMARILHNDKMQMPQFMESAIKSDIINVLSNYLEIDDDNLAIKLEVNRDNMVEITCFAIAKHIKIR